MNYITHRRFKERAICGEVNIPAMTKVERIGDLLFCNGQALCAVKSENAHQYFAVDEDGNGLRRGKLTQAIQKRLNKSSDREVYQARWDKVWDDKLCQQYKRPEYDDYWLWNHEWFEAPIEDLEYIAALVGAKEE